MAGQYRIMTLHPDGKKGVNIAREKYDIVRCAILEILSDSEEITFKELGKKVKKKLRAGFEGSISWYYTTVKLDLEARGEIERVGRSPQILRLSTRESDRGLIGC